MAQHIMQQKYNMSEEVLQLHGVSVGRVPTLLVQVGGSSFMSVVDT